MLLSGLGGAAAEEHPAAASTTPAARAADPRIPRDSRRGRVRCAPSRCHAKAGYRVCPPRLAPRPGCEVLLCTSRVGFRHGRYRSRRRDRGTDVEARQHRGGARSWRHADGGGRPARAGRRPGAVGRPGSRAEGDPPAVLPGGRAGPAGRPAPAARRHPGAVRPGRERRRRAHPRRGGARARRPAQRDRPARGAHPAVRRVRRPGGPDLDQRPGGRRGRGRLRGEPDADVPALGGAAQVPDRGVRHLVRRGGGDQVDHLRGQRAVRLRDAARRARHAPDGPHLQVRQPGAQADLVRRAST